MKAAQTRTYYGWWIVGALSLTQLTTWGAIYYSFGVLLPAMEADLGWSRTTLTGAFSLALLVSALVAAPAGRWIDAHGTRSLMTAGSVAATLLLVAWAQVGSVAGLYLVFAGLGLAMAATLYEPAFAAVAVWFRARRSQALAVLTFFGGLASLVFIPLIDWLARAWGWRGALLALALIVGLLTILPHALILRRRPEDFGLLPDGTTAASTTLSAEPNTTSAEALRQGSFWLLATAFSLTMFVMLVLNVHLVSYLIESGYTPAFAAAAAGMHGLMSVSGRLTLAPLGGRLGITLLMVLLTLLQLVGIAVLLLIPGAVGVWMYVALFGIGSGASTPVRAALVAERYGRENYGAINGALTFASIWARVAAPVGAGWLSTVVGYGALLWGLVGALAIATGCMWAAGQVRNTP